MKKRLLRSRSGEGYPMVIAVTLCLLMLFMVIEQQWHLSVRFSGNNQYDGNRVKENLSGRAVSSF